MKNLLFLLADQFRFDALGAENPLVQTPHLDALAEAGARFTRAYTPLPVCAPARQALYTGRHPDSFGAYWNYGFFPTPPISPEGAWPRALKAMGYSCGFIGKWNVSPADGPEAFGYDTVVSAAQYSDGGAQYTGGWLGCMSLNAAFWIVAAFVILFFGKKTALKNIDAMNEEEAACS